MITTKKIFCLLVLSILFFACKQTKVEREENFDKNKWAVQEADSYPYRNNMLRDLVYNRKLHGLKYDSVITLLGKPNRVDTNYLFYTIKQPKIGGVLPMYTKSIAIEFAPDSIVKTVRIHE